MIIPYYYEYVISHLLLIMSSNIKINQCAIWIVRILILYTYVYIRSELNNCFLLIYSIYMHYIYIYKILNMKINWSVVLKIN